MTDDQCAKEIGKSLLDLLRREDALRARLMTPDAVMVLAARVTELEEWRVRVERKFLAE